jgi:hypothetical protein
MREEQSRSEKATTPNSPFPFPIPSPILCTIPSKALLLMNLQTLQSANPSSTPFTLNPPPIPTNLTKLPDRLHPILVHPWSSRLVISHWRRGQKFLDLLLCGHCRYPRYQQRIFVSWVRGRNCGVPLGEQGGVGHGDILAGFRFNGERCGGLGGGGDFAERGRCRDCI